MQLSIVIPCLNEERTIVKCIEKAKQGIASVGMHGEVIVADNGSSDHSVALAEKHGARVVHVKEKGYGSAVRGGISAAQGHFIIMGDADQSYDFSEIKPFVEKYKEGYDMVIGNRFSGTIEEKAMPFTNRYIGNPVLSLIGRTLYGNVCGDFHCGLRGITKATFEKLELKATGMEFATEMIIAAAMKNITITEVPITLYRDGRNRPPHLRKIRDGLRHLHLMFTYKKKARS